MIMRRHHLVATALLLLLSVWQAGAWTTDEVPCDFVTGGGFIVHSGAKANFGVAGGVKNGAFWGHLEYNDHTTSPPMRVHGTSVGSYIYIDENTRYMQGTCRINGVDGYNYEVKVTDNGEPGRNRDQFSIGLSNGYTAGAWSGDGPIRGGNIQLHKGNRSNTPPPGFTCRGADGSSSEPPPPPHTVTRIEEDNTAVVYTGTWYSVARPDVSGGTVVKADLAGETATLSFNGTGVSWIGFKGPVTGFARVYIDGSLVATINTYAATEQPQAVIFTSGSLAAGPHTLKIEVTGTYDPASCCAWIAVDAFDVSS
jgi:hypothetical protein